MSTNSHYNSTDDSMSLVVRDMLGDLGRSRDFDIAPISGGRNNRVYRVDTPDGPLLLKAYYHAEDDTRDRLAAEFAFLRFAWNHGIRCVPQPLAMRADAHVALYEWIDGVTFRSPLSPALSPGEAAGVSPDDPRGRGGTQSGVELAPQHVEAAIAFFLELNRDRASDEAAALPVAAEACFSPAGHLALIERRVALLETIVPEDEVDHEALRFVSDELQPALRQLASSIRRHPQCEKSIADRWVSPSDFGFHNALLTADGEVRFFDFEYAGRDDPAKTVCDFFRQPQVPVPPAFRDRFVDAVAAESADPQQFRGRVQLLWPLYGLKWWAIMLNEFLPAGARRRAFGGCDATAERKQRQLDAARQMLESAGDR